MTQTTLMSAQVSQPPSKLPVSSPQLPESAMAFFSLGTFYALGFIAILEIILLGSIRVKNRLPRVPVQSTQKNPPCRGCRFYQRNYYLECAVHPSIAMTEAAIDCSDYCPAKKVD